MKVHQLARKLGVKSSDLVKAADVPGHNSNLTDEQVRMLTKQFEKKRPGIQFNQAMPWHEVREKNMRRIVQAGAYFTYAEQTGSYNNEISQNMLEPTPQFVEWFE